MTLGTVIPSAWSMPPSSSSARTEVEISGVPEPRAEFSLPVVLYPGPVRFHCTITEVVMPEAPTFVQRQNSHAFVRSADTIVMWPSEPGAGYVPLGIGIGWPSHFRSCVGDQSVVRVTFAVDGSPAEAKNTGLAYAPLLGVPEICSDEL